jgi:hypothetical protein
MKTGAVAMAQTEAGCHIWSDFSGTTRFSQALNMIHETVALLQVQHSYVQGC